MCHKTTDCTPTWRHVSTNEFDGSLLHIIIVLDNQEDPTDPDSAKIHTAFENYAPVIPAGCSGRHG
jgi:hypothetical protein